MYELKTRKLNPSSTGRKRLKENGRKVGIDNQYRGRNTPTGVTVTIGTLSGIGYHGTH